MVTLLYKIDEKRFSIRQLVGEGWGINRPLLFSDVAGKRLAKRLSRITLASAGGGGNPHEFF